MAVHPTPLRLAKRRLVARQTISIPSTRPVSTSSADPSSSTPASSTTPPTSSNPPQSSSVVISTSSIIITQPNPSSSASSSSSATTASSSSSSLSSSSSSSSSSSLSSSSISSISPISSIASSPSPSTVIHTVTNAPSQTSAAPGTTSNKTFFQNTGAVAGVFTVVGIAGLILAFILITTVIRRRRAQKFDRDVAEAAAHAAATSHDVDPALDDDDGGQYGYNPHRDLSKSSGHGTLSQDPVGFAAYGDYNQQSYNMADLGGRGTGPWNPATHHRTGSDAPGVAGVGAGAAFEDLGAGSTTDPVEGAALRYRRTQTSAHGHNNEGFYDAAAIAGGYYGASRAPDGGYGVARFAPQNAHAGYPDLSHSAGYVMDDAPGGGAGAEPKVLGYPEVQGQGQGQGHYLSTSTVPLPNPHTTSQEDLRVSAAYGGFDEGDPFALQPQLSHSHSQSHSQSHSVSPLHSESASPPPAPSQTGHIQAQRSVGSHEGPLSSAFGMHASEEDQDGASDAGSVDEDYAGERRILKVANE